MARPRIRAAATATVPAAVLLLLMSGCSHYQIGIPLVPGLSLGLGATRDGSFSMGLNTGFGPLGAGVAVNNGGVVSGSAGVGVGVALGPVGTGVGVGKSVVLHDPKTGAVVPAANTATTASAGTEPVAPMPVASAAPVTITKAGVTKVAAGSTASPSTQQPAVRISRRTPTVANATVPAGEAGTPGNPIAP
ncbi:hypothetical protein [Variovorax sp. PAMC26660]|uniref:hypothetical protein n=1 Tax=Variovorax sp. PAMC26660 TaxID=2762322 RepID=UPI0021C4C394|nr:hypothetical protein [Variovorax sp. PAMC26660]